MAVPFLLAVAVFAGTPAMAGWGIPLVPVGDEPNASGEVRLKGAKGYYQYSAKVFCNGLTPGARYSAGASWLVEIVAPASGRVVYRGWNFAYLGEFVAGNNGAGSTDGTLLNLSNLAGQLRFGVSRSDGMAVLSSSP